MHEQLLQILPSDFTENFKVVSSSALRTKLTCEGLHLDAEYRDDLYHASCAALRRVSLDYKNDKNLILVGHNPGLTEFVNSITQDFIENVPTLGVCLIELFSLEPMQGKLIEFIYPKKFK